MATRYAVASGSWSDSANVWSDTDGGAPGSFVPVDGDTFVIRAGVSVLMDVDQSAWTGLAGTNIIRGGASPGMLYWANGTNGYLKLRSAAVIEGTLDTNRGRLLANSNGTWGNSTPLQQSNTAKIDLQGTTTPAHIHGANLDIALHATHPTNTSVVVYNKQEADSGQWFDFDATTDISEADDTITLDFDPPANGDSIMFRAASGSLPGGLLPDVVYYVRSRNTTSNTLKVGLIPGGSDTVALTQAIGSCEMYTEFGAADVNGDGRGGGGAYATFDVFTDVTSDTPWAAGARVILSDDTSGADQQRGTINASFPTTTQVRVTFSGASGTVDSAQEVAPRLWLIDRNVQIISTSTTSSTTYPIVDGGGQGDSILTLDCSVVNTYAFSNATASTMTQLAVYNHSGSFTFSGVAGCVSAVASTCSGSFEFSGVAVGCSSVLISCGGVFTFSGTSAGCSYGINSCAGDFIFSGLIRGTSTVINTSNGAFQASGTITGCGTALYQCTGAFIYSGSILESSTGLYGCSGLCTISGTIARTGVGVNLATGPFVMSGTLQDNGYGIQQCSGQFLISGTITHCTYGVVQSSDIFTVTGTIQDCIQSAISNCYSVVLRNADFSGNALDLSGPTVEAYDSNFDMPTSTNISAQNNVSRSFRHRGVANDTRGRSGDNSMTHETVVVPSGQTFSHKFTYNSADYPGMMQWEITRPTNGTISIPVHAKHDATGLSEANRIHWEILDAAEDPLIKPTATPLDQWIATDSTDWQNSTLEYTKVDDRPLLLRVWARRASGNAYALAEEMSGAAPASGGGAWGY